MKTLIIITSIASILFIYGCNSTPDFSGTYYFSREVKSKADNTYLPERKSKFTRTRIEEIQQVTVVQPNSINLKVDDNGNYFGTAQLAANNNLNKPFRTFDIQNARTFGDTIFFELKQEKSLFSNNGPIRLSIVKSETPVLLWYISGNKSTDSFEKQELFTSLEPIKELNDKLINSQIEKHGDRNDPNNPHTQFYSQYYSHNYSIF